MKKRFGDRWDATLIRDADAMHFIMPIIYPNRCDNEAYIMEKIDLTNINEWLAQKNALPETKFKYTLFQVIVTALLKTINQRPKLNRFVANKNMYQRDKISASFIVKKEFSDESGEGLAFVNVKDDDTIETIREKMQKIITGCRKGEADTTQDAMDILNKIPRFLGKAAVSFMCFLESRGKIPKALVQSDPYYSSVIISNLGSIKLKSGYHHLTNWGTTSMFCVIGEKKMSPFYDDNGNATMHETLELGLTVDERIADGYYFSKSIKLLKHLLQNPTLLESEIREEVQY